MGVFCLIQNNNTFFFFLLFCFSCFALCLTEISKSLAAQAEQGKNVCEKGPVMLLHEIFNDAQFECLSSDGPQHSKFKVQVLVNNARFEGTGKC